MLTTRVLSFYADADRLQVRQLRREMEKTDYNQLIKIIRMYENTIRSKSINVVSLTQVVIKFRNARL